MSLTGGHLDAFLAAGLTAEQIVALVKADITEREKIAESRRAKDAERQRRHRESRDVTVTNDDTSDRVSLDKETSPRPPKEINPIPCVSGARARGWHRLPEDWVARPLPAPVQTKVDQWPPGALADELAAFRRWAANAENKNGKGKKLDWDQAWRNWIGRRHEERYGRTHTMGRNQPADGLSSTARASLAVFGR